MKTYSQKAIFVFLLFFSLALFLNGQHDTSKANILLEEAIVWYEDGAYAAARKPLEKVLAIRQKYYPPNDVKIEDVYYWLGSNEQGIRNNEKSLEYYFKGLDIAKKRTGEESEIVADFYMDIANTYDQMYKVVEAKKYYQKVLSIYKKKFGAESSEVGNVYMNIGIGQRKMGNYQAADYFYEKAYENFKKSSDPESKDFYRIYINKSVLLCDLGDYDLGLDFILKSLRIKLIHYDTLHPSVHKYYSIIGDIYQAKGQLKEALLYQEKALMIAENTRGKNHPETAGALGTVASIYADQGAWKEALALHQRALKIQEKSLSPSHPYLVASYLDIGWIYKAKKEWKKALKYYELALAKYRNASFVPKHFVAQTLRQIGEVQLAQGEMEKALLTIREGISNIAPAFQFAKDDLYTNPTLDLVQAEISFLELLAAKASFLQTSYKATKKQSDLEQALKTSELAIEIIEKIRRSYQSESAKEFLNSSTASVFDNAVEQAFELYRLTKNRKYLQKAFSISEKSKASILWQNLNSQYALKAAKIPVEIQDSIRAMDLRIGDLEEQLLEGATDKAIEIIQDQIFEWKEKYGNLLAQLEQYNQEYYHLKYAPAEMNIADLVQSIPDGQTAVVEYYYTAESLFIFVLTREGLQGVRQSIDEQFSQGILQLRNNDIQQIALDGDQLQAYIRTLNGYYQLLVEPIGSFLKDKQKLILVPHGVLQYLSFESLTPGSSTHDFRHLDYLLKKYAIQYHWSAALWAKRRIAEASNDYGFLGFAPSFEEEKSEEKTSNSNLIFRRNLSSLANALPELEGAQSYFSGNIFSAAAATESQFKATAPQSNIIHLATHGIANDLSPMQSGLLFSNQKDGVEDGFLQALEIYNMELSADLAVMSACNTGYGQFSKGEGIMSLGRAFLYAGCKSVVMSLWLANDESTSTIVQHFYKYLAQGLSKDEALQKAKVDYLAQADPLTAHPYFWANLVAVGDMTSLQKKESKFWWWGGMALVGLFFLGFVFRRPIRSLISVKESESPLS